MADDKQAELIKNAEEHVNSYGQVVKSLMDITQCTIKLQFATGATVAEDLPEEDAPEPTFAFTISPDLPDGLRVEPRTGRIVGTAPASAVPPTAHILSCKGPAGFESSAALSLEIVAPPSGLAYARASMLAATGRPIEENPASLAAGGAACAFLVEPPLPEGLAMDPALGHITGQPAAASLESVHTVRAVNVAGACACELRVTVMAPPSELSYVYGDDGERVAYVAEDPVQPNRANTVDRLLGTGPFSFAVAPPLPPGLTFDPATGAIAGTPAAPDNGGLYVVTACNAVGEASCSLLITILPNERKLREAEERARQDAELRARLEAEAEARRVEAERLLEQQLQDKIQRAIQGFDPARDAGMFDYECDRADARWFYNSWEKRDAFAQEQRTFTHGRFKRPGAVSGTWFGAIKGGKIPDKFRD